MDEAYNHSTQTTAFGRNLNTAHDFLVPVLNMYEQLRLSTWTITDEAIGTVIHLKHDHDSSNKHGRTTNPCNEAENVAYNTWHSLTKPRQRWKHVTTDISEFHFHTSVAVRPDKCQELMLFHSKPCHMLWCCNLLRCWKLHLDR